MACFAQPRGGMLVTGDGNPKHLRIAPLRDRPLWCRNWSVEMFRSDFPVAFRVD